MVMNMLFHAFFDQRATLDDQILMLQSFWQDKRDFTSQHVDSSRVDFELVNYAMTSFSNFHKMLNLISAMKLDYITLTLLVSLAFFDTSK